MQHSLLFTAIFHPRNDASSYEGSLSLNRPVQCIIRARKGVRPGQLAAWHFAHLQGQALVTPRGAASVVRKDSTHAPWRLQNARRVVWRPFVHQIPRSVLLSEKLYFCAADFAGGGEGVQGKPVTFYGPADRGCFCSLVALAVSNPLARPRKGL